MLQSTIKVNIFRYVLCYLYLHALPFSENDFVGLLCLNVLHNSKLSLFNAISYSFILCLFFLLLKSSQKFFFKSQVIAKNKFDIGKCEEYVWVTKDELMESFPEQAEFFNKMIIS